MTDDEQEDGETQTLMEAVETIDLSIDADEELREAIENTAEEYGEKVMQRSVRFGSTIEKENTAVHPNSRSAMSEFQERRPRKSGETVKVRNRDGSVAKGEVVEVVKGAKAGTFIHQWMDAPNLAEYWAEEDIDIDETERVVKVELGSQNYHYPESRVERLEERLQAVSGVGSSAAEALREAGFESKSDLRRADQEQIANVEGIGNALAAHIKADVGNVDEDWVSGEREDDDAEVVHPDSGGKGRTGEECPNCEGIFDPQGESTIEGDGGTLFCCLDCLQRFYS